MPSLGSGRRSFISPKSFWFICFLDWLVFSLFFFGLTTAIRLLPILFCVSAGTNGTLFASIYRPSLTQQVGLPRHLAKKKGKKSNPDSFFLHSQHDGTLLWKIYCKRNDLVMNRVVFFFGLTPFFLVYLFLCVWAEPRSNSTQFQSCREPTPVIYSVRR